VRSGDSISFKARYTYGGVKPEVIVLEQRIDGAKKTATILFPMRGSYYDLEVSTQITDPKNVTCKAISKPRRELPLRYLLDWMREYNEVTQTYPIGLFDERPKPVSEYPVSGVDNAVLDIPYSWSVQNTAYPQPALGGLSFTDMRVEFSSGFLMYEGRPYKDPSSNNTVRVRCRIVNNSSYDLSVRHWGLVLSTLYEDNRHVSQANVDVSFPSFDLYRGQYRDYYLDVNIPSWAYGRVAIAHAMNFYDKATGTLRYAGGPFYCFEVYRLRLP